MPRNASGIYSLPAGNPVVAGTVIEPDWANPTLADIGNELTQSLPRTGTAAMAANLPMGNHKIVNLGAGAVATDAANLQQVQYGAMTMLGSVAGADTVTAAASPTLGAYAVGQAFKLIAAADNTGPMTLNIDSKGAKAILKNGGDPMEAGDIATGQLGVVIYDGTNFQLQNTIGFQPVDDTLTALAGTLTAANKVPYATGVDTAGELDFVDEDNMASDSATAVPSQQSVKAYADNLISGAATEVPDVGADYLLFEDATDSTQKKALIATVIGAQYRTPITISAPQAEIEFLDIPANARRITIMWKSLSPTSTPGYGVQLGTASAYESTGYTHSIGYWNDGYNMNSAIFFKPLASTWAASTVQNGKMILEKIDPTAHTWMMTLDATSEGSGTNSPFHGCGHKTMAAALTKLKLMFDGANTFDAGTANIIIEV
jgi:hypothetical protein